MPHWRAIREKVFCNRDVDTFAAFLSKEEKHFSKIPFADNYLFQTVLSDERICQLFLGMVLQRPVKIVDTHIEYLIQAARVIHGVRLDVCVELEDGTLTDVEMQVASQTYLRQRIAAYRANLVVDQLYKTVVDGRVVYDKIRPVVVIFVCDFSPACVGDRTITYYDVVTRHDGKIAEPNLGSDIIINLHGTNDDNLDKFLDEFRNALVSNGRSSFSSNNELVSLFVTKAREIQDNKEWRLRKMSMGFWESDVFDRGYEGGRIENLLKNVCSLMQKKGWSLEESFDLLDVSSEDRSCVKAKAKELGILLPGLTN